jgi:hypothetical protein
MSSTRRKSKNQDILDEFAAADHIGMSVQFLRSGRCAGIVGNRTAPPRHLKLGTAVRYRRSDLDSWLAERVVDPAARHARQRP